jgi:Ni/Fe-hydrogenase subunit HybB-like protein
MTKLSAEEILYFDTTWQGWRLRMTPVRAVMAALTGLFVLLSIFRLFTGLGAATNLSDAWPWGLWIGFDLTAVALAGAGYSMCFFAHVLHIDAFHSISRRSMLLSLLGYVFVLLTLILEIGRWDNAYMPLISWGHASALFEVYIAITIYVIIQAIEFSEVATEKIFHSASRYVQMLLPTAFIIGAILPFGHQASLGGIYLLMKGRLHPLWWSRMLPWFFLITSFYVGQAMVILESLWSERSFGQKVDLKVLRMLAKISACIMSGYFLFKFFDLAWLGELHWVLTPSFESGMFLLEMVGCVLLPAIIAFSPWGRGRVGLLVFSVLCIAGVVLSRINVVFTGMYRSIGPGYVPSIVEWGITIGLLAAIGLAYIFIVENFNIFLHSSPEHTAHN